MPTMSQLDYAQIIKSVYDATNQALQVNVVATTGGGGTIVQLVSGDGSGNEVNVTAAKALKVDGSAITQPVSAVSLPLPTGASTSALQTTGNSSLSSIDSKTATLVGGRVPVDGSGVTQHVSGTVTANAGSGTFAISAASLPLPTGAST
jgi:hypothetical protein